MAERSVTVRLRAVVDDYRRAMGDAAKSTEDVGAAADKSGKQASGLSDAARAVGRVSLKAFGAASTAVIGLGTAALSTGVAYNSLEQNSRAALTTLLGSAQAATEQMNELREFGRTSPFPRQVWIEAQRTLIAFGMEAKNVIPTLGAINDAIAATGGGAQEIQEVVRVLAQVQSTSRVTAENLNQLGVRGIDAAGLIGESFGKTAAQIRDDISSGTLDAQTFLTTLTEQMEARFGGAAANLQQTWTGALDRLKGAFRDVGAIMAEPFVDPMGGGAAVDFVNALADALRGLEVVMPTVASALTSQLLPGFGSLTDLLRDAADAMREADLDQLRERVEQLAPAIGALGAAGATASTRFIPFISGFGPKGVLAAGIAGFVLSVPEARDALVRLGEALMPVAEATAELAAALVPVLTDAIVAVVREAEPVIRVIEGFGGAIEWAADKAADAGARSEEAGGLWNTYAAGVGMAADAAWSFVNTLFPVEQVLGIIGDGLGVVDEATRDAAGATGFLSGKFTEGKAVAREYMDRIVENTDAVSELADGTAVATEELQEYLDWVQRATDPIHALHGAVKDVDAAQRAYTEAVEEYGEKSPEAADAALNLTAKLDALEAAALNGDLSFDEFEARLDSWVRQGKITEGQAKTIRDRVEDLREEAEDYTGEYNARITETGGDKVLQRLRDIGAVINGLPSRKDITIAALTGSHTPTFGITRAHGGPVDGPGSPTVDSIPAMLAPGEFVMRAAARAKYGDKMMDLINRGLWPAGGLSRIHATHDSSGLDATDFINTAGRVAAAMGVAAGLGSGRVLPRGSYRIGRGSAAHGYGALDLPAPIGTPVYSVAAGIVSRAMRLATSYGIHAFVNHPGNRQSRYAHLSSLAVRAGQTVRAGQLLGRVGSTGNSTGPHLHYEDLLNGVRRRPESLGIFDHGGWLKPGMLGMNTSPHPEAVLSPRQSDMFDRFVGAMERSSTAGGGGQVEVDIRISGSGAHAEQFKASVRKGEIQILVDGRRAQVA